MSSLFEDAKEMWKAETEHWDTKFEALLQLEREKLQLESEKLQFE